MDTMEQEDYKTRHALGLHILIEAYNCDTDSLSNPDEIRKAFHEAAELAGMTVVAECYKTFEPHGASGMTIVAESHLSVHSWPEFGYAAIDVFTCGADINLEAAIGRLQSHFQWSHFEQTEIKRGLTEKIRNGNPV